MANKTTKQHFKIFTDECDKWITRFGLFGWHITYIRGKCGSDIYSQILWNMNARECDIYLNEIWPKGEILNTKNLECTAFHEVIHLLLLPIRGFRVKPDSTEVLARMESDEHAFIQRMVNAIWEVENADKK